MSFDGATVKLSKIHFFSNRCKGFMFGSPDELRILSYFRVEFRRIKTVTLLECLWYPPVEDDLLLCCNDAATNNPGMAGAGIVARNSSCDGLLVLAWVKLQIILLNSMLSLMACSGRLSLALVVSRFPRILAVLFRLLPWQLRHQWLAACANYDAVSFVHAHREVNFRAGWLPFATG